MKTINYNINPLSITKKIYKAPYKSNNIIEAYLFYTFHLLLLFEAFIKKNLFYFQIQ